MDVTGTLLLCAIHEFTSGDSNIPIWNTVKELNRNLLPEEDWQYHVSIKHTAMCENIENISARRDLGICYFPEQQARMDVLLYEISQADAEEVNTSTGKTRRFDISSAHGFAAVSYAMLTCGFVHEYFEGMWGAVFCKEGGGLCKERGAMGWR